MADEYWDHPSRRETKRLIDLGDANAILDELQDHETEWDDAREALDYLIGTPREQVKRVRDVAAYLRDCETNLKEQREEATNDAQATALLSSAALTGNAAHRIEQALDGTEADRG